MMPFTDPRFVLLPGLRTESFVLRPITVTDTERDYEAVMESREYLRKWEQSTWPEDDFNLESNRSDLIDLEAWNAEGRAFSYTVLDPSETVCLGCVYIFPPDAKFLVKSVITPVGDDEWTDFDAVVYHWVRKSQMDAGKDAEFFSLLRDWLAAEWNFDKYLFVTNEQFVEQEKLFRHSEMSLRFTFSATGDGCSSGDPADLGRAEPGRRYLAFAESSRSWADRVAH